MKKIAAILLISCFVIACSNTPANIDPREDLKKAMTNFLYKNEKNDTNLVKYHVLSVIFFEEKNAYLCDFKVNVHTPHSDTTGVMRAEISKDMKTFLPRPGEK